MEELLDRGFWHSLMGLLSIPGRATVNKVIELAAARPINLTLGRDEAVRVLNLAKLAKTAGREWFSQGIITNEQIPIVPLPPIPSIDSIEPGEYQASLIIKPFGPIKQATNVIFSAEKLPNVQTAMENVQQFLLKYTDQYIPDAKFQEFINQLRDVPENWLMGRGDLIVPNWLVRGAFK